MNGSVYSCPRVHNLTTV